MELAFVVLQGILFFLEVFEFKHFLGFLLPQLFEWTLLVFVALGELSDHLLGVGRLLIELFDFSAMLLYKSEVVRSRLIVICLEISKGLIEITHKLIDM